MYIDSRMVPKLQWMCTGISINFAKWITHETSNGALAVQLAHILAIFILFQSSIDILSAQKRSLCEGHIVKCKLCTQKRWRLFGMCNGNKLQYPMCNHIGNIYLILWMTIDWKAHWLNSVHNKIINTKPWYHHRTKRHCLLLERVIVPIVNIHNDSFLSDAGGQRSA